MITSNHLSQRPLPTRPRPIPFPVEPPRTKPAALANLERELAFEAGRASLDEERRFDHWYWLALGTAIGAGTTLSALALGRILGALSTLGTLL